MLAALFLCADFMPASEAQTLRLRAHKHKFMQMYLKQSMNFNYLAKDVYAHNTCARVHNSSGVPEQAVPTCDAPEGQFLCTSSHLSQAYAPAQPAVFCGDYRTPFRVVPRGQQYLFFY